MRSLRALLVAVICTGFTPGLGELLSDGAHLLTQGHTHHAEGHAEPDVEHGCNGVQHSCPCHASLSVAPVSALMRVPAADVVARAVMLPASLGGPAGVRASLDRPPRA